MQVGLAGLGLTNLTKYCIYFKMRLQPTCRHIPVLTLQPKLVLTARGGKPSAENNLAKADVSCILGRSSAITQHVLTQFKLTPRWSSEAIDVPRPRVHNSITPYEQNVSRTKR